TTSLIFEQVVGEPASHTLRIRDKPQLPTESLQTVTDRDQEATAIGQPAGSSDGVGSGINLADRSAGDGNVPQHKAQPLRRVEGRESNRLAIGRPRGAHKVLCRSTSQHSFVAPVGLSYPKIQFFANSHVSEMRAVWGIAAD